MRRRLLGPWGALVLARGEGGRAGRRSPSSWRVARSAGSLLAGGWADASDARGRDGATSRALRGVTLGVSGDRGLVARSAEREVVLGVRDGVLRFEGPGDRGPATPSDALILGTNNSWHIYRHRAWGPASTLGMWLRTSGSRCGDLSLVWYSWYPSRSLYSRIPNCMDYFSGCLLRSACPRPRGSGRTPWPQRTSYI